MGPTAASVLAAEFHGPTIDEFFPPAVLFAGTPFELNRVMLIRILATVALCAFFWIVTSRARVVPGRTQSVAEIIIGFVRTGIAEDMLGKEQAKRFLPLIATVFFGVLAMNITGVIPGLNIASTAVIGAPLVLALTSWVVFNYAGVKKKGVGRYLKDSLFPPGVPKPLYILLTPIEFVSTFFVRPFTLTIRLLANMMVGHLLLAVCFSATSFLLLEMQGAFKPIAALTFVGGFAFVLFEIFIEVLQAYIFALLFTSYIQLAMAEEH